MAFAQEKKGKMGENAIMPRQEFVTMVILAVLAMIWLVFLSGCAGPEPPAPISYYRAQYGFAP